MSQCPKGAATTCSSNEIESFSFILRMKELDFLMSKSASHPFTIFVPYQVLNKKYDG
jgi:hypothetical protein